MAQVPYPGSDEGLPPSIGTRCATPVHLAGRVRRPVARSSRCLGTSPARPPEHPEVTWPLPPSKRTRSWRTGPLLVPLVATTLCQAPVRTMHQVSRGSQGDHNNPILRHDEALVKLPSHQGFYVGTTGFEPATP